MIAAAARFAHRAADAVAAVLFAVVFVVFMAKVGLRYALHVNLDWADEVCQVLFVWIIFWTAATLMPDRAHIAFDLLVRALPPRARRAVLFLRNLAVFGLFAASLPASIGFIRFLWRQRTPVLQLRLDLVYACFGLFMAAVLLRALAGMVRACRPG